MARTRSLVSSTLSDLLSPCVVCFLWRFVPIYVYADLNEGLLVVITNLSRVHVHVSREYLRARVGFGLCITTLGTLSIEFNLHVNLTFCPKNL